MQVETPEGRFLNQRRDAMLLIGPTGSGKTPLGQYAEQHGIHGRACLHFDFGCQLRAVSEGDGHPETIGRKLQIFEERTVPLLAFYRRQGVPIINLTVDNISSPAAQWQQAMVALGVPFTRKSFR